MLKMIDFWAPWCGPCKMMEPILEEVEKEYAGKMEIVKVNVDEAQDQAAKQGVMSIPTYVFIKDGQEVDRLIGYTAKKELVARIEKNLG
ncbi:MAG: thioredoxin [Candidatus Levybacteria bacterium]|nr:thioredoxin [Candidatus Levybacteria bacterium]